MAKLLVLDKGGTLVRPKSGNTFVQCPEDQDSNLVFSLRGCE